MLGVPLSTFHSLQLLTRRYSMTYSVKSVKSLQSEFIAAFRSVCKISHPL